jgi:hypothetical protein
VRPSAPVETSWIWKLPRYFSSRESPESLTVLSTEPHRRNLLPVPLPVEHEAARGMGCDRIRTSGALTTSPGLARFGSHLLEPLQPKRACAFEPLCDTLLMHGDSYMHLADLKSYLETDERLTRPGADQDARGTDGHLERGPFRTLANATVSDPKAATLHAVDIAKRSPSRSPEIHLL